MKPHLTFVRWWIAGALCELLAFLATLPALAFMALVKAAHRGADRAELELNRAGARTRRTQPTNRIPTWKKPL